MGNQTCIRNGEMYMASDGKKFEPAVRNAMTAVFNVGSTPYLRKLESEMTIQKIEVCPETFVQNLISYENRSIYETTRGGEAQKNTDRKHYATEYGLWDFKFDTQDYFKEDKRTLVVPGTTFTEGCPKCGNTGIITCPNCEGKGKQKCSDCDGTGMAACPDCSGTGLAPCPKCDGTGKILEETDDKSKQGHIISCPDCNGSGKVHCEHCDGTGHIPCVTCHGTGEMVCKSCAGTGKIKCPDCKGSGTIVNEVEVSSEIHVKEEHNILFMSTLREDMVPFFAELKPEFETHAVATYESSEPILSISTGDFNFRIRETSFNSGVVFNQMASDIDISSGTSRINKYRVNVFQRIFLKITYSFNEKVYLMYYDCGEKKSYLTANPYNDVLQRLADDILVGYREKDYKTVAVKLQEYRSLRKSAKGPVNIRNNPEKIAESICDRFTVASIVGMIIPLLFVLIYFSGKYAPRDFRQLLMWSMGISIVSVFGYYKLISYTWSSLVRRMKLYAAYLSCTGLGLILSSMTEFIIAYLVHVI
ncbi:MAG: hypothetical protein K6G60_06010 [Lachnospiraceae bacterium]|nr:hypothetical protein [Lachnospiraceae bacterium]